MNVQLRVVVGNAAYAHHRQETTSIGNIRSTFIVMTIRNNYAVRFKLAMRQYNSVTLSDKKWSMFGDLFLMHRNEVIFFWTLSMICEDVSVIVNPIVRISIVISVLYIAVMICNIVIFYKNNSLFDDTLMIHNNDPDGVNSWYIVPIHTRIEDRAILAAVGGNNSAGMGDIREHYTNMKEIQVLVYTGNM